MVIRGLEAVRTDWTPLARRVQRELLRRVFAGEPFAGWLEGVARDLAQGKFANAMRSVFQFRIASLVVLAGTLADRVLAYG